MQGLSKKYILLGWIWKPIGGSNLNRFLLKDE